jgi:hypothetical protein
LAPCRQIAGLDQINTEFLGTSIAAAMKGTQKTMGRSRIVLRIWRVLAALDEQPAAPEMIGSGVSFSHRLLFNEN